MCFVHVLMNQTAFLLFGWLFTLKHKSYFYFNTTSYKRSISPPLPIVKSIHKTQILFFLPCIVQLRILRRKFTLLSYYVNIYGSIHGISKLWNISGASSPHQSKEKISHQYTSAYTKCLRYGLRVRPTSVLKISNCGDT